MRSFRQGGGDAVSGLEGAQGRGELGVQVFGQPELVAHLEAGGNHYSHCISIGNPRPLFRRAGPETRMPRILKRRFRRVLRLRFYDVEEKRHLGGRHFPRRVPERADVRRAIEFYRRTRGSATGYTIHCWQGISRSTAFALGLLYLITGSEAEAARRLITIRPEAGPHPKIVRFFDRELGSNLSAVNDDLRQARIKRWQRELDLSEDALLEELPGAP